MSILCLDPEQKGVIKSSWEPAKKDLLATGKILFKLMFERYPAWEELFPAFKKPGVPLLENPDFQNHVQKNVMNTLSSVIDNMEDEAKVKKTLCDLGARHISRNVKREHFMAVTGLFLDTMKTALGADFDPAMEAAWKQLMDAAMSLLGDGAEGK